MLTMTDMFCGAGGSSTGALEVPGIEVKVATNHWDLAIETHNTNHQDADHVLADVSQIDPRYFPHSDILWASPECTNHSVAKGVKRARQAESLFDKPDEAAERSRATMWDVPRFAEHHQYKIIITENVVDAARWVMWDAWLHAMDSLGYDHHVVYLNSMHAQAFGLPAPQSRDRMYVVFWLKGNPRPNFERLRPLAFCAQCDEVVQAVQVFKKTPSWGRYRTQYVWRCPRTSCRNAVVEPGWLPASSIIDWSLPAQRIGDREKPLAAKTMRRIEAGLKKYVEPFLMRNNSVPHGDNAGRMSTPTSEVMRTLTTAGHQSLVVPVEGRDGKTAQSSAEALRTQTTRAETGLAVPPLIVNNVSGADASRTTSVDEAAPTFVAGGLHASLLVPAGGTWHDGAHPTTAPLRTLTTREAHGVVQVPAMHLEAAGNTYDSADPRRGGDYYRIWSENEPLRTMHTSASKGVVIPPGHEPAGTPFLTQFRDRVRDIDPQKEPLPTVVSDGAGHGVIVPLRNNNRPKPTSEPLDTFAAAGNHHGLAISASIDVMDCLFRMLSPHEIKLGMAFPVEYVLLGTKRQQVRMAGNAVTPPVSRDLLSICVESLYGIAA